MTTSHACWPATDPRHHRTLRASCAVSAMISAATAILAAAATGCAGGQAPITKDRIVQTTGGPAGQPLELLWAKTDRPWHDRELFVTVHGRDSTGQEAYAAAIYRRAGDGFVRLARLHSDSSAFLEPTLFWAGVAGSNTRERLVAITELFPGTSDRRAEHLFLFRSSGDLVQVEFVPAPTAYATRLAPGEGVWKGEQNAFGDEGMTFSFFIWREGDANCCPSAGSVTGAYVLEELGAGYRVAPQSYSRLPVRPS